MQVPAISISYRRTDTAPVPTDINEVQRFNPAAPDDLAYVSSAVSGAGTWRVRLANASGGYQPEIDTGISNTNYQQALSLQWDGDSRIDLLVPLAPISFLENWPSLPCQSALPSGSRKHRSELILQKLIINFG